MDSLRSLLPKVLRRRGLAGQAGASHVTYVAQKWLQEVLPGLAAFMEVRHLKDGVLTIACRNGVAAQECRHLSSRLLDHVRRECPDHAPEEIRLTKANA
ncbi:MAG: DUF721 domain-containing protein [Candidatus Peribacteraceae bacterium]|nr:DUF721 domain-containing protein [Candidatus Peribacteraceae bacterium]